MSKAWGSIRIGAGAPSPTHKGGEIKAIVKLPLGSPDWFYTNHYPWEDVQFNKDMKQYRQDYSSWIAGSATAALEKALHNWLVHYINYKQESIANPKLPTIEEE